ncbi:M56 family metallopeptidase [Allopontixanthobacter sp.]|uniref:M56 family metallopeptidase n=1 Tax=Allopontixanthobacter sp. TaxID=2906452 RepID=UPI002AB8922C|nr:M56 family metallopeptidase [Allopontixanthobacter sp.]MDZ4307880.1 M56 family metallopeptidase [Allopontixanthobacter sp.]
MTEWLVETLLWTGALIGLVLLVRRPVGRHFGAKAAYALWALPLLRLIMPPLVLPACLAFGGGAPEQTILPTVEYSAELAALPTAQAASVAADPAASALPIAAILLTVWLAGAAIFLVVRFSGYFRMRRSLLAQGRPVGEAGAVRLIETPQATAPLAFGVFDKVVALPPGFMALYDREQRDFALAHELAHHSGGDLLANMAVQPLFALHWFNPLAWLGWRALRRDQEAACDARVIARRSAQDRAAYAQTIAGFAAGPHLALAAPMACPVLGEKSIIHRLRSISMSDISPRRRLAGRLLIGASLLALPLTASISYAEARSGRDATAEQPPVPPAPPLPPQAPDAPQPPEPPAPPLPPSAEEMVASGEFDTLFDDIEAKDDGSGQVRRVIVMRSKDGDAAAPGDRKERRMLLFSGHGPANAAGAPKALTWAPHGDRISGKGLSDEERVKIRRQVRETMVEVKRELANAKKEMMIFRNDNGEITRFAMDCKEGQKGAAFCQSDMMASTLAGLMEARAEIARNKDMQDDIRAEVLKSLDEAIADWNSRD